jgi:uncharacterized protein (DUF488 family)
VNLPPAFPIPGGERRGTNQSAATSLQVCARKTRRRGFSKSILAAALERAGIRYQHARALGNPKPFRERYKDGDVKGGARKYRAHLHNGSYPALVELPDALSHQKICLLCFEETHDRCHRAVIAGAIAERLPRVAIVHL